MNVWFLIFFVCAVCHSFIAHRFARQAERRLHAFTSHGEIGVGESKVLLHKTDFYTELLSFIGQVEIVFGLWCIPLFIMLAWTYGWSTVQTYVNSRDHGEAIYIVIILAITSTYPIIRFAEKCLGKLAEIGGGTPLAWWVVLLCVGPLLVW